MLSLCLATATTLLGAPELVETAPEPPPIRDGWVADEQGRLFQVNFDLNRRIWIGTRWFLARGETSDSASGTDGGVGFELGLRADVLTHDLDTRIRYRSFDTQVALNPFSLRATLFEVDTSTAGNEPFLRVTTFVGGPDRHDLFLNVGWWLELLTVEHQPRASARDTTLRILAGGMTWDLWQDADMTSYLRLRTGGALDDLFVAGQGEGDVALVPLIALEADFTFDDAGFHHLVFESGYEALFPLVEAPRRRFLNAVAYEVIALAINDQPVTLRVAVEGGYRDDLDLAEANGWELRAGAGLRVSLWAPPRDLRTRDRAQSRRDAR